MRVEDTREETQEHRLECLCHGEQTLEPARCRRYKGEVLRMWGPAVLDPYTDGFGVVKRSEKYG